MCISMGLLDGSFYGFKNSDERDFDDGEGNK